MLKYHENIYSWEDEHIIEKKMVIFKKKEEEKKRLYFNHDQFLLHVKFKHQSHLVTEYASHQYHSQTCNAISILCLKILEVKYNLEIGSFLQYFSIVNLNALIIISKY